MKTFTSMVKSVGMALLTIFICSCSHTEPIHFSRLEQVLFETEPSKLQATLASRQDEFGTVLLNIDPANEQYMGMLSDFVRDEGMRHIYHVTDSMYHDISWLEEDLGRALANAEWLNYDRFFTLVTGDFEDYSRRVFCSDHELAVSLDHYAVGSLHAAVPAYVVRLSQPQFIAADCMAAIARAHIAIPQSEMTLLDYAIAEGKVLYFLEKTMPWVDDTIRLRYSGEQLKWMEDNLEQVWAYILQNRLLYSTDRGDFHNLMDDAPKTNAFGDGSAPRTVAYIGWKIVGQYAKKSGVDMQTLLNETDSRKMLTESSWRP